MGTYVIGDVHGCFEELVVLLKKIETEDNAARYIFVGDLLDRGPDSIKTALWALENITADGKYVSVCGNHDGMIADWAKDRKNGNLYAYHYGTDRIFQKEEQTDILMQYAEWTKSLPLYIEAEVNNKHFVITHGFVPLDYKEIDPFERKMEIREEFNWDRSALYNPPRAFPDITIVCGHNPVILPEWITYHPAHEIATVYIGDGLVNVDTGCFHSGLLSAYRLEDGRVFYSGKPGVEGYVERKHM